MTNQEIFNKVVRHVRKQGRPSIDRRNDSCKYRMKVRGQVLMCGIGCLIPDKEYISAIDNNSSFNSVSVEHLVLNPYGFPAIPSLVSKKRNLELMKRLQFAHDVAAKNSRLNKTFVKIFNEKVKDIACKFRLKVPK